MPHFVDDGEDVFQRVGVVEQDIRIAVVASEAVGAAGLALVFVHVDPALFDSLVHLGKMWIRDRVMWLLLKLSILTDLS